MSNFQKLLNKHRLDYGTFNTWTDRCEKQGGTGKRALDAYERSLKRCEIFESDLQTWMMRHVDDTDFEAALKVKGKRLEELEALSVERLKRVFALFLAHVKRGR